MHLDKYAHLKSMNYIALDKILNQKVVSANKWCLLLMLFSLDVDVWQSHKVSNNLKPSNLVFVKCFALLCFQIFQFNICYNAKAFMHLSAA